MENEKEMRMGANKKGKRKFGGKKNEENERNRTERREKRKKK